MCISMSYQVLEIFNPNIEQDFTCSSKINMLHRLVQHRTEKRVNKPEKRNQSNLKASNKLNTS